MWLCGGDHHSDEGDSDNEGDGGGNAGDDNGGDDEGDDDDGGDDADGDSNLSRLSVPDTGLFGDKLCSAWSCCAHSEDWMDLPA